MNDIYAQRLRRLREKKIQQTQEKYEYEGCLDEDDYGRIVPTFAWHIIANDPDGSFYGIDGWTDNICDLLEHHDVFIDDDDAFTGRWMYFLSKMRPHKYKQSLMPPELEKQIDYYKIDAGIGFDAHFCPDYRIGLELGWKGLLEKIDFYRKKYPEKKHFYDCHERVIKSIQVWIKHHIDKLDELAQSESDAQKKQELLVKKKVNEHILNDKPKTLREAMQWIIWFHLVSRTFNRDGAGGQLDTLLEPYYDHDLKAKLIDREEAVYFMGCFLVNDPAYWQIGGPDANGNDQTCELSYIILDAAEKINVSLNLTLRVHDKMNMHLFDKAVRLLVTYKEGWPRFSGDNALVDGFCRLGYDKQLARQRIAVGCNWMSLPGMEYTLNDLFKINMAKIFEISWQTMMRECGYPELGGDIGTYIPKIKGTKQAKKKEPAVALLWKIFSEHLSKAVHITAEAMRFHLKIQPENETELLLNLLSHGPIERGLDISGGGAMYYNLAIDAAGLGTVSDSFTAIEQRIEKEKKINWETLDVQLRTNWRGIDGEQQRLMMSRSKHYGSSQEGTAWAVKISHTFSDLVIKESNDKLKFIPGLFSWAKSHLFGRDVGATPDGRRFGDPITHGANPVPHFIDDAASLSMSTAIAAVQPGYGNTAPLQLELDPSTMGGDPVEIVKTIILTHFDLGGTLINVNIINKDVILAANKHPELYPELIVRVTGFTAYFCMLTPEFRQLVVDRIVNS
ncbi:MAG: formate acetyltransferase [Spirochaetia bacterium]|jgi:formate C-acetyltransferase|nr:formate acetyltransferase [Spirochaetia bacterium]